ncbi:MAG: hypothetical protein AB8H12_15890 [Lewinella sp.]
MSRRYTLALVGLILAQFCALYSWQQHERNEALMSITSSLLTAHEMAITSQEELLEMDIRSYEELMRDDTKARFRPLSHFVTENYASYESLGDGKNEQTFREECIALIETVSGAYETMMMTYHESMDLNGEDAKFKCSKILELAADSQAKLAAVSLDAHPVLQGNVLRLITLDYLQDILSDAMVTTSGRALIFDQFFPVFMPDRCAYESGDTLNARVAVGSYSNSLDPANVKLIVNGQELNIGLDGTAEFNAPVGRRGEHSLKTKVVVSNPLTGEVKIGEGRFLYRVE